MGMGWGATHMKVRQVHELNYLTVVCCHTTKDTDALPLDPPGPKYCSPLS